MIQSEAVAGRFWVTSTPRGTFLQNMSDEVLVGTSGATSVVGSKHVPYKAVLAYMSKLRGSRTNAMLTCGDAGEVRLGILSG